MTKDEATELWRMVYSPYSKQQQPTPEQGQAMFSYLMAQSYEIVKPAIDAATRVCNFPPVPADIERAKAQIAESRRYDTPGPTPVDMSAVAYQDALIRMPDADYAALLAQRRRGA
jgi:hypothetical protein